MTLNHGYVVTVRGRNESVDQVAVWCLRSSAAEAWTAAVRLEQLYPLDVWGVMSWEDAEALGLLD